MNGHLMRVLLALYPRAFRDRYGAELAILPPAMAGKKAAAKPDRFSQVFVRQTGTVPGKLSFKTLPLSGGAMHASLRPSPAGPCVMVIKPLPAGWTVRSVPGSILPKPPS